MGDSMSKKKNQVSIQARRRLFFLRPICLFLVFFLCITLLTNFFKLYKLNGEKEEREKKYIELQERTEYLKNEVSKLNDSDYLAKFARENYSYSKDGEIILKIDKSNSNSNHNKEKEDLEEDEPVQKRNDNKKIYLSIGISLFIFYITIVILRRKKVSE